jgi:ArsR family transcriptional regulator
MGTTKTAQHSPELLTIAEQLRALSNPARLAIMDYLAKTPGCICGDLTQVVGLSQPTVSQHLKALKQANLIQGTIDGNSICYCINPKELKKVGAFLDQIQTSNNQTCCS